MRRLAHFILKVILEYFDQRSHSAPFFQLAQHFGGYFFTSEKEELDWLLEGLAANVERYGYPLCPCRMGTGNLAADRDIICPCDYRDADLAEYGQCY